MNDDAERNWLDRVRDWQPRVRAFVIVALLVIGHAAGSLGLLLIPSAPSLVSFLLLFVVLPLAALCACVVPFVTRARVPVVGVGWGIALYLFLGLLVLPFLEVGMGPFVPLWPTLWYWHPN